MSFSDTCMRVLFKPRVLHRLPGRLRVHVPSLKKIPSERSDLADLIAALITIPDEIREVRPDLVTGNALILYDADRAREDQILDYVNALLEIILRNRGRLDGVSTDRLAELRDRLVEFVRSSLTPGLVIDSRLVVPDELLAP